VANVFDDDLRGRPSKPETERASIIIKISPKLMDFINNHRKVIDKKKGTKESNNSVLTRVLRVKL
jgi:hypothetical protein